MTRLLGKEAWQLLNELRVSGKPGRAARMLYEVLGDVWVIQRNPYLQEDMLFNKKRRDLLIEALYHRINSIREQLPTLDEVSAGKIAALMETALVMIEKFKGSFEPVSYTHLRFIETLGDKIGSEVSIRSTNGVYKVVAGKSMTEQQAKSAVAIIRDALNIKAFTLKE